MSEQSQPPTPQPAQPQAEQPQPVQPQPTVFDRFFPGPGPRDPQLAARLQAIAEAARQRSVDRQQRQEGRQHRVPERALSTTPADASSLTDAIHEQTEVLRGLLDAEIAVRDDARATAQNSRTFAIAGIAIAFFTLIAAVVTVVVAIQH